MYVCMYMHISSYIYAINIHILYMHILTYMPCLYSIYTERGNL